MKAVAACACACAVSAAAKSLDLQSVASTYAPAFTYGGVAFDINAWKPSYQRMDGLNGQVIYTSPDRRVRLTITYRAYEKYPVYEIRPVLECDGGESAIIDGFSSLKYVRETKEQSIKVRRITGSKTLLNDFMHQDAVLMPRFGCDTLQLATNDATSAGTWLPYFGIDFSGMEGLEIAVGWTGAWRADMLFDSDKKFTLTAGMDTTHFKMLPGEKFIMPSMLVYERVGQSVADSMVQLHRFFIECKAPRDSNGELFKPLLPITAGGGNKNDSNMLKVIEFASLNFNVPFDTYWVDANWYGPPREQPQRPNCAADWHLNVGDWRVNTWIHPAGDLSRVADAAAGAGMRFLLWFEPERCVKNAPIMDTNPEYFHCVKDNPLDFQYLLDLGNDDAWQWAFDMIVKNIDESHVKIYRQDFNFGGKERIIWRDMDAADRRGVSEIKHINGLWKLWDALRERYPDMLIDNCASGGRRMDFEMMSRAHSYCRDDAHMVKNNDNLTQNITLTSTPYIPFTGGETFTVPVYDTYAFFSRLGAGTVFTPTDFDGMIVEREPPAEELAWFNQVLGVAARVRQYFMGDFYALTNPADNGDDVFCAYQLNDPKESAGFYAVFRRDQCPLDSYQLRLNGIDAKARYEVEPFGEAKKVMSGAQLASQLLEFPQPHTCKLVFYKRI